MLTNSTGGLMAPDARSSSSRKAPDLVVPKVLLAAETVQQALGGGGVGLGFGTGSGGVGGNGGGSSSSISSSGANAKSSQVKKTHQILLYPDQMGSVSAGSLIGLTPIGAQSMNAALDNRVIAAYVIIVCMVILLVLLLLKMFVDRSRWSQEVVASANANQGQGTLRSQIYGEYQAHNHYDHHYGQLGRSSHLDDLATLQNHQNIYKSRTSLCTSLNPAPLAAPSLNPPPPYTISHTNPYAYFNANHGSNSSSNNHNNHNSANNSNTNSIYKYYCVLAAANAAGQTDTEGGPT